MRAIKLDIAWPDKVAFTPPLSVTQRIGKPALDRGFWRRIEPRGSDSRCPHCRSVIYSRRHRLCGVCGEALPEALLFSPDEARRIKRLIETERLRHKAWMGGQPLPKMC